MYGFYSNYKGVNGRTHYISDDNGRSVAVQPETVGQYTGVVDPNGKQIFEGDIVGHTDSSTGKTSVFGVVRWSREGCFYINTDSIYNYNTENSGANIGYMMPSHRSLTIIGNIHDNPELLD